MSSGGKTQQARSRLAATYFLLAAITTTLLPLPQEVGGESTATVTTSSMPTDGFGEEALPECEWAVSNCKHDPACLECRSFMAPDNDEAWGSCLPPVSPSNSSLEDPCAAYGMYA